MRCVSCEASCAALYTQHDRNASAAACGGTEWVARTTTAGCDTMKAAAALMPPAAYVFLLLLIPGAQRTIGIPAPNVLKLPWLTKPASGYDSYCCSSSNKQQQQTANTAAYQLIGAMSLCMPAELLDLHSAT